MPANTIETIKTRLRLRLKSLGRSDRDVSLAATGRQETVRNIMRGRMPGADSLAALARELQTSVAWLVGETDVQPGAESAAQLGRIQVVGAVQAGAWRETWEWPIEDRYSISVPDNPRYRDFPRFALRVQGRSMDQVFPEGAHVVCVRYYDLGRDPRPGDYLVAIRRDRAGLLEATVKQLIRAEDGGLWLWPRSSDPQHQQPIRVPETSGFYEEAHAFDHPAVAHAGSFGDVQTESLELYARVVGFYRDYD